MGSSDISPLTTTHPEALRNYYEATRLEIDPYDQRCQTKKYPPMIFSSKIVHFTPIKFRFYKNDTSTRPLDTWDRIDFSTN